MRKLKKIPIIIMASEELDKISSSFICKIVDANKSFLLKRNGAEIEIILQKNINNITTN